MPPPPPVPEITIEQPPQQPATEPGFISAEQWQYIQNFHETMNAIEIETCSRCNKRWFEMHLRAGLCRRCSLRDKNNQLLFLINVDNNINLGEVFFYLLALSQVKEIIIARLHVQMVVYRVRGHQYYYSGYCVSFTQNIVKTVNVLLNLLAKLNIVLLRLFDSVLQADFRYFC
jgi:hypothetical protein